MESRLSHPTEVQFKFTMPNYAFYAFYALFLKFL